MRYERLRHKVRAANWLAGLVLLGVILCLPKFTLATPTTNLLIADSDAQRVIEVDPITHNVIWQYGQTHITGTGTNQLDLPMEAIKLPNGHVLIADTSNCRVIEVQPIGTSGGTIVWQYGQTGSAGTGTNQLIAPEDVKKLPNGKVLITDRYRVIEVQPTPPFGGSIVWQYNTTDNLLEAERLVDGTTLIVVGYKHQVIRVNGGGSTLWSYGQYNIPGAGTNQLNFPKDANQLVNGNILISDYENHRVIEVQPLGTSSGTIVWQYGQTGVSGAGVNQLHWPYEAVRSSNGNTLIVDGANRRVIEVKTNDYPSFTSSSIVWQQGQTGVYGSGWNQLEWPRDIEEIWQGIYNQVMVEYNDIVGTPQPIVTAWAFTPLTPALPPVLEVTKSVSPSGTQSSGTELTYTIAYTNTGQGTATIASFTDMVPIGTIYGTSTAVFVSGPSGTIAYSHDGGTNYNALDSVPVTHIRWTIPAIGPGVSGTLRFSVRIQ